jgi:hypothetical protein
VSARRIKRFFGFALYRSLPRFAGRCCSERARKVRRLGVVTVNPNAKRLRREPWPAIAVDLREEVHRQTTPIEFWRRTVVADRNREARSVTFTQQLSRSSRTSLSLLFPIPAGKIVVIEYVSASGAVSSGGTFQGSYDASMKQSRREVNRSLAFTPQGEVNGLTQYSAGQPLKCTASDTDGLSIHVQTSNLNTAQLTFCDGGEWISCDTLNVGKAIDASPSSHVVLYVSELPTCGDAPGAHCIDASAHFGSTTSARGRRKAGAHEIAMTLSAGFTGRSVRKPVAHWQRRDGGSLSGGLAKARRGALALVGGAGPSNGRNIFDQDLQKGE